jgi:aspartate kinase
VRVFKFGGFSVSSAVNIQNLVNIIKLNGAGRLLVVVSAMGKTTDALERLCTAYIEENGQAIQVLDQLKAYHHEIMDELFGDSNHPVYDEVANTFMEIEWMLEDEPHPHYDFNYDQIVSIGELVSSKIISAYLTVCGHTNTWLDARSYIHTDNSYREGLIDWDKTTSSILKLNQRSERIFISQGFIGGTSENFTTTLGREGSDYSAAVFASCLAAESLTVWKDVPGIMNADPALFPTAEKYTQLPYLEALELAYHGANIIHPKTIKPLQNSGIPLFVKPFLTPEDSGTEICEAAPFNTSIPAIIVKKNQVLITISTTDFSYMDEMGLAALMTVFSATHIKLNMLQPTALSLSGSVDNDPVKLKKLEDQLTGKYQLSFTEGLELLTILYFNQNVVDQLCTGRTVLLEQLSKDTAQFVLNK